MPLRRVWEALSGWFPQPAALRSRRQFVFGLTVGITLGSFAARVLFIPQDYDELMLLACRALEGLATRL